MGHILHNHNTHVILFTHTDLHTSFLFTPLYIVIILYNTTKMFLTRSEYDRGVNTFSPEGRYTYMYIQMHCTY